MKTRTRLTRSAQGRGTAVSWVSPLLVFLLSGCGEADSVELPRLRVARVPIDTDVELEAPPGQGVGTHVEARSGGEWELFFTCDTEVSGYACEFDVIVSVEPGASLVDIDSNASSSFDFLRRIDAGAVSLFAHTSYEIDWLRFSTSAGETLRIDVLLDGAYVPETVFWSARGSVRSGAPTMPLELTPI